MLRAIGSCEEIFSVYVSVKNLDQREIEGTMAGIWS